MRPTQGSRRVATSIMSKMLNSSTNALAGEDIQGGGGGGFTDASATCLDVVLFVGCVQHCTEGARQIAILLSWRIHASLCVSVVPV